MSMSLQKLQSIVTVFEKNDYNSPSAVVTAVRQLLNIFQIDVTAEEATELIAMMKEKIEVAM